MPTTKTKTKFSEVDLGIAKGEIAAYQNYHIKIGNREKQTAAIREAFIEIFEWNREEGLLNKSVTELCVLAQQHIQAAYRQKKEAVINASQKKKEEKHFRVSNMFKSADVKITAIEDATAVAEELIGRINRNHLLRNYIEASLDFFNDAEVKLRKNDPITKQLFIDQISEVVRPNGAYDLVRTYAQSLMSESEKNRFIIKDIESYVVDPAEKSPFILVRAPEEKQPEVLPFVTPVPVAVVIEQVVPVVVEEAAEAKRDESVANHAEPSVSSAMLVEVPQVGPEISITRVNSEFPVEDGREPSSSLSELAERGAVLPPLEVKQDHPDPSMQIINEPENAAWPEASAVSSAPQSPRAAAVAAGLVSIDLGPVNVKSADPITRYQLFCQEYYNHLHTVISQDVETLGQKQPALLADIFRELGVMNALNDIPDKVNTLIDKYTFCDEDKKSQIDSLIYPMDDCFGKNIKFALALNKMRVVCEMQKTLQENSLPQRRIQLIQNQLLEKKELLEKNRNTLSWQIAKWIAIVFAGLFFVVPGVKLHHALFSSDGKKFVANMQKVDEDVSPQQRVTP